MGIAQGIGTVVEAGVDRALFQRDPLKGINGEHRVCKSKEPKYRYIWLIDYHNGEIRRQYELIGETLIQTMFTLSPREGAKRVSIYDAMQPQRKSPIASFNAPEGCTLDILYNCGFSFGDGMAIERIYTFGFFFKDGASVPIGIPRSWYIFIKPDGEKFGYGTGPHRLKPPIAVNTLTT